MKLGSSHHSLQVNQVVTRIQFMIQVSTAVQTKVCITVILITQLDSHRELVTTMLLLEIQSTKETVMINCPPLSTLRKRASRVRDTHPMLHQERVLTTKVGRRLPLTRERKTQPKFKQSLRYRVESYAGIVLQLS